MNDISATNEHRSSNSSTSGSGTGGSGSDEAALLAAANLDEATVDTPRHAVDETWLYSTHYRPLIKFMMSFTRDRMLAEDLTQDALLVVIKRLRHRPLDDSSKLTAFIFQTTKNLYIADCRRKSRRKTECEENIDGLQDEYGCSPTEDGSQSFVWDCLGQLQQNRDRDILIRSYLYGEPKEVTCRSLAMTPDQYDKVISRARQRLRRITESAYAAFS